MRFRIPALAIPILTIAIAEPTAAQAKSLEALDENGVLRVWTELDRHWNARDANAFVALFKREASFVFVDRRESLEGYDQILQRFSGQFPAMAPDLRHRTAITETRSISRDAMAIDGTVQVLRAAEEGREPEVMLEFAIFGVMVRGAEGWKIGILRVVELPDEPGDQDCVQG
jgi:uncharacterized protein (TIGR02246 family)